MKYIIFVLTIPLWIPLMVAVLIVLNAREVLEEIIERLDSVS